MKMTTVFYENGQQAVRLPDEFRVAGDAVWIRKDGDAIVFEPVKARHWPERFFEQIRVDDPAFGHPPQGTTPSVPNFGK